MFLQMMAILLVCILAFMVAVTIAGFSLSVFGKFLRRAEDGGEEQNS
ncbi:MAG TPA: hypothetical protein VF131_25845 [Blastocatellia bacterium]|jgi:hypothetical protein|nr:hypothetical protein [Blastocatellia bacterium]